MSEETLQSPIFDPALSDLLDKHKRDIVLSINCVKIGKIESFSSVYGTATASISAKRLLPDGRKFDYPPLKDCPVFILGGGSAHLSMPIEAGDPCIVLFNDRDIDTWFYAGKGDVPNTARAHALSDGIVLVGIRPLTNLRTITPNIVELQGGTKKVSVKNAANSLKTVVDNLLSATQSVVTILQSAIVDPVGPPAYGFNAATQTQLTTLAGQLSTLSTQIALLLE